MVKQGMKTTALDETCQDYTILLGQFAELYGLGILEVGLAGDDEFVAT